MKSKSLVSQVIELSTNLSHGRDHNKNRNKFNDASLKNAKDDTRNHHEGSACLLKSKGITERKKKEEAG